ncbi:MAG: hypothetical protein LBD53_05625 [Tannerella sp.]|jgi:tetratricopeptide (TPR) repeat protein|nr:hypothetical protein [Tannerella sp.]
MTEERTKRLINIVAAVIIVAVAVSCGARKNNASSRFYHSLNSRYNIYFNGKTSFDEALKAMNDGYKENYTQQIALFPVSGVYKGEEKQSGSAFNRAIEKGNKAIKLHSIKDKPPRRPGWQNDPVQVKLQAQEEFNPFTKHCWLLVAESRYYNGDFLNAAVTYSYIARHFATEPDLVAQARIGEARCYSELGWFYETQNIIRKLSETGYHAKLKNDYERMFADYMIRQDSIMTAIPYLQNSIKAEKNRRQKARQRYLLGQLYARNEMNDLAYKTFGKVASSNPPYEIEFAARIRQTEVFSGGDCNKIVKMLKRMAKSDKNKDFLDQVYYAMGNVYMTQQDTTKAIESYALGIEKSTLNGFDKAVCQIRLGDIYFTQTEYLKAQPCFSGAISGITKEYKDYERVAKLSEALDALAIHFEAVTLQDSLQKLAQMPEKERLAVIDKIIEQVKEDEKRAKEEAEKEEYLAQQNAMGSNLNPRANNAMPPVGGGLDAGAFYFYNMQVVNQGKTQFQTKWGKRTLEDNWRRRNKKTELLMSDEEIMAQSPADSLELPSDSLQAAVDSLASDPLSREYYLQQIPLTPEDLEASNKIIEDGLYNMGMVYKDKLEDKTLTVNTFETLDRRFPDNIYRLDYYYQVYIMALMFEDTELAASYRQKIINDFPESDYAIAVSDPDYVRNMRLLNIIPDSLYQITYSRYLADDTAAVRANYNTVSTKFPLSELMPKYMFINALSYVQSGDALRFKDELTALTEKYPNVDVTELASEILKNLLRGRVLVAGGGFTPMTWNFRFGSDNDNAIAENAAAQQFKPEKDEPFLLAIVYPTGSIERNKLLYAVAAYNFANFKIKTFDFGFEETSVVSIMTISGFSNFDEVMQYYTMIYSDNGYARTVDNAVSFFPISTTNYDFLIHGKTLEEYITFFNENYGENYPFLVENWRQKVEADKEAAILLGMNSEKNLNDSVPTPIELHPAVKVETTQEIANINIAPIPAPPLVFNTAPAVMPTIKSNNSDEYDEERAEAKGQSIIDKLVKRVKETNEYQSIKKGIETTKQLAGEDEPAPADSVETKKPLERIDGEMTLDQIRELRDREAKEQAARDAEAALSKEEAAKAAKELKAQQAKEKEQARKQKEKEAKERLRQKEKERKAKAKENAKRLKKKK